ncbi:MAG: alginate O-acetyltransferase complex protein AlgI, partial [Verrucomicrobiales bacterium]
LLLLAASYYFYACWDARFLSLIILSTVVDYVCGLKIAEGRRSRQFLWISVLVNLGMLATFKYFNFFADNLLQLLEAMGFYADPKIVKLMAPVGISFYTFQTMSYTIDVYRGSLKPTRNFINFAVFVAYFPQLVAGPIERASRLLPQIEKPRTITYQMFREGAWLILLGYFMKTVMADNLAIFVGELFDDTEGPRPYGMQVPIGILAYAFQIYGDFGGYSNIARGLSKWMGIELMVNFRMPYFSCNPADFWRRWHISLSTWLRDYLYIPLGGNRGGTNKMLRNLILTMLLGGLWHGAAWHFVAWGAYHGLLLAIHRMLHPILQRMNPRSWAGASLWKCSRMGAFFILTLFGWVLFRATLLSDIPVMFYRMFDPWAWNAKVCMLTMLFFVTPVILLDILQEYWKDMMAVKRLWKPVRLAIYLYLFICIVMCSSRENYAFVYFQF